MRFATSLMALAASVAVASPTNTNTTTTTYDTGNILTFWTLDTTSRVVKFTPNPGSVEIASVTVSSSSNTTVSFPDRWAGNAVAVPVGETYVEAALAEIAWDAWNDISFFDVSSITNLSDTNSIMQFWPEKSRSPVSGCQPYPCNTVYYHPDDVQTLSSTETAFWITLGQGVSILDL